MVSNRSFCVIWLRLMFSNVPCHANFNNLGAGFSPYHQLTAAKHNLSNKIYQPVYRIVMQILRDTSQRLPVDTLGGM